MSSYAVHPHVADPGDLTWQARAACHGTDPRLFDSTDPAQQAEALSTCKECPVTQACGEWASHVQFTGVAGGRIFKNGQSRTVREEWWRAYRVRWYRARKEAAS